MSDSRPSPLPSPTRRGSLSASSRKAVKPVRSPGSPHHRLTPAQELKRKRALDMLDRMERQAQDMEELSHLSFQPTPQRWARDFPSVLAAAGNAADERLGLDEPFDATGRVEGVEEEDEEKPPVDPNLVSFVMVLRRAEAWRDTSRADLEELQQRLLQQFDTAGLRVCELECGGATLDRYIGLYATLQALLEEKQNVMSENFLSWQGADIADLPTVATVSPAEKMLLTRRIINRCIDFIRVSRAEDAGFTGKAPMLQRLGMWCRDSCTKLKLQNVTVQLLIKDIFGLHCKRVRTQLFRLFAEETRVFCCRSFQRNRVPDERFNEDSLGNGSDDVDGDSSSHILSLFSDLPPMVKFCDELRYHYGSETAVFFAFSAFCFRQLVLLSIIATPVSLASIVVDDAKAAVLIRGVFGLGVAIVWSPIFTRLWERCYNVLRVRWTLDAKSARLGLLDPSTNQKPIQEVSSNENPYNPRYIWKYDELLRRKVRVYVTTWRPLASICLLPATWVLLLVVVIVFTLFAIWGGTYMMVLPSCDDCQQMVNMSLGKEWYDNQDEPVLTPYDRYRFYEKDVFLNGRSYDEFIFTFSDNFSRPDIPAAERTCLPTECSQASTYILWGTCWNNPSGLPWEGTPLLSFIIFTALIMRPITGALIAAYEAMVRCITKLENWDSLRRYNEAYVTRRFTALWLNLYWFNMMLVFIITRFGPSINTYRYERCRGVQQVFNLEAGDAVDLFEIQPFNHSSGSAADNLVDLLLQIPGADVGSSVGVWNPENPLIAGLWIGCLFDLILTQSSFIAMLFWPGFFVVSAARCCRSRENCSQKCCVCMRPVLPDDAENETVLVTDSSFLKNDSKKQLLHQPSYTSLDGLGQRLVAMSAAGRRAQRSGFENISTSSSESPGQVERKSFVPDTSSEQELAAASLDLDDNDIERGPSSPSPFGCGLELVSHLRKYDAQSLLRLHKLADFKKLSGVLDYPSMILLTMVVAVFTIFFPFLVIFVTGGVLLEMLANLLGLLGFSRVSIVEASGDGRWTWMILWTQYAAVPVVMSYFVFNILEFTACEDVEIVRDIGDGTGIPFCYDPLFDTFSYDHTPFAFMWVFFSIIGVFLFRGVLSFMGKVPTVVARQEELVGIIHKNTVEVSMVVKGLAPSVVKALETVYGQLDKNPIFRVQQTQAMAETGEVDGRPGDGEVPTYIILGFMALLLFSTEDQPDDGGTGFYKLLMSACRDKRTTRRGSILELEAQVRAHKLYKVGAGDDVRQAARNADILSAMANFDCDDSNTIRFAEFANGYRKFRSSGQQLRGSYNCEPREWDRRLVKLSLIFAKAAAILRPKVELGRITVAWRRRLDKIAELRAAGTIAAARSAAHEASTRILDQNADGKTDFAEATNVLVPKSSAAFKAESAEHLESSLNENSSDDASPPSSAWSQGPEPKLPDATAMNAAVAEQEMEAFPDLPSNEDDNADEDVKVAVSTSLPPASL